MSSKKRSKLFDGAPPEVLVSSDHIPNYWYYNFLSWAQNSGIEVDGRKFEFKGHLYLVPMYLDRSERIVLQKAAQMGATIMMALRKFHQALYPEAWGFRIPVKVGFYFPDKSGITDMVSDRFEPMMWSCADLQPYAKQSKKLLKKIGDSSIYYRYMEGKSTKDSAPLNSLLFDEVRLMKKADIDQAEERLSHSPIKYTFAASTAGYEGEDINEMFLESDQKWFHTICERCNHEQVMAWDFPNNVSEPSLGSTQTETFYICMKCKERIRDTQRGQYIPHGDPNHPVSGYHISQLLSHYIEPYKVMQLYRLTSNKKEFFNAKLGMPYVDEENRPISIESLSENAYGNISPMMEWGRITSSTFMGVDQMMNLNYITIVEKRGDERRLVWFEIVEDRDPFRRTAELMEDFNVRICVCDAEPNTNDALKFARMFNKRVFLAKKGRYEHMVRWHDHWKPKRPQRKASKDEYYQFRVFMDTYQSIERTLNWISEGRIKWPDPDGLVQEVAPLDGGRATSLPILRTHGFPHFSCAVREKIIVNEDRQEFRFIWKMIKYDPHALDALNYAITASNRKVFF